MEYTNIDKTSGVIGRAFNSVKDFTSGLSGKSGYKIKSVGENTKPLSSDLLESPKEYKNASIQFGQDVRKGIADNPIQAGLGVAGAGGLVGYGLGGSGRKDKNYL